MTGVDKKRSFWAVTLSNTAAKMTKKMPIKVLDLLPLLLAEIEVAGPIRKD